VKSNIHTIVSSTSIEYNSITGLFSTPLGVVTQHAIDESRLLLAEIKQEYHNETKLKKLTSQYLRFIPHAIGMKFNVHAIFPNDTTAIEKELNILDSLQASFDASQTPVVKPADAKADKPESVFKVDLATVPIGSAVHKMCTDFFNSTNKSMHGYQNLKIANAYKVDINHMSANYDDKKVGNHTQVWHGTSEANLLSILKNGLKTSPPSTAYIAGKMFGNGIYGSQTASKSLGYTMGRWGGSTSSSGWLFICDFAMGTPYYPTSTIRNIPAGYHSCWALPGKCGLANDELIVYRDQQVNIKYLLEITR
jgi:poly [ADP-ribose] polymerase